MTNMIDLKKLLETILWTGYLDDEDPVSLFIIAKPERGKTSVIAQYMTNKGIGYFTDVTAWGISDTIIPLIEKGENIHHILIPDFLNCALKSKSSADKLIMFLHALTEEGITNIASYANRGIKRKVGDDIKNSIIKCGIITCITRDEYVKRKNRWQGLGFLSRFLPIQYEYSSGYVDNIFKKISENNKDIKNSIILNFPKDKQHIELPYEISRELESYAKIIGKEIDALGIRLLEIFRTILKANALKNGRNIVSRDDLEEFKMYIEFIQYKSNNTTTIDK